ncbi:hypothetical protein QAD02_001245 [Eretmocerus hayati]|uniref:Uncharacterized protein n=1 Tax=Eretmocerus hayati TaxID=131215 RepID=A0ACC2NH81_9HYME|nr:hypothetical protein QAD02_001245 [Eretmocerus hayati]
MACATEISDDEMDDFMGFETANSQNHLNNDCEMNTDNDSAGKINPKGILKNGKRTSPDDEIQKNLTSSKNKKLSNIDFPGQHGIFLNDSQPFQNQDNSNMNSLISNHNTNFESNGIEKNSDLYNSNSNLSQISGTSALTQSETTDFFPRINFKMSHFMKHHRPPFTVHVSPISNDVKSILSSKVGSLLIQSYNNINEIYSSPNNINEIYQINKRKIGISIPDRKTANSLLDDHVFPDNGLNAVIPLHLITTDAIIKGVPLEISTQQIVQLAHADGNVIILSARRLNKKTVNSSNKTFNYTPSTTILVTFDSYVMPRSIRINYVRYNTERYKPSPKQCYKCYKFGHLKKIVKLRPYASTVVS